MWYIVCDINKLGRFGPVDVRPTPVSVHTTTCINVRYIAIGHRSM